MWVHVSMCVGVTEQSVGIGLLLHIRGVPGVKFRSVYSVTDVFAGRLMSSETFTWTVRVVRCAVSASKYFNNVTAYYVTLQQHFLLEQYSVRQPVFLIYIHFNNRQRHKPYLLWPHVTVVLFIWDRFLLDSPGWPGTCYTAQWVSKTEFLLPESLGCWNNRSRLPHPASF